MAKKRFTNGMLDKLVDRITETYKGDSGINFIDAANLPVRGQIIEVLEWLFEVLFPGHTGNKAVTKSNVKYIVGDLLSQIYVALVEQINRAYQYQCRINNCRHCDCGSMAEKVDGGASDATAPDSRAAQGGRAGGLRGRPRRQELRRDRHELSLHHGDCHLPHRA